jgi:hypothetical protein
MRIIRTPKLRSLSCSVGISPASEVMGHPSSSPSFTVMNRELKSSPWFIVYGDVRFTGLGETKASLPYTRTGEVASGAT